MGRKARPYVSVRSDVAGSGRGGHEDAARRTADIALVLKAAVDPQIGTRLHLRAGETLSRRNDKVTSVILREDFIRPGLPAIVVMAAGVEIGSHIDVVGGS
jgi:hypothetical protein